MSHSFSYLNDSDDDFICQMWRMWLVSGDDEDNNDVAWRQSVTSLAEEQRSHHISRPRDM